MFPRSWFSHHVLHTGQLVPCSLQLGYWIPRLIPSLLLACLIFFSLCLGFAAADEPPLSLRWSSTENYYAHSLAWGDYDNDGDLDLVVGNYQRQSRLYRNDNGTLVVCVPCWPMMTSYNTYSLAWGDINGDGYLDLAMGNSGQPNYVYLNNKNGTLAITPIWTATEVNDDTRSLAWGDVNGDGYLDLAVGNYDQPNRLYLNNNGILTSSAVWSTTIAYLTRSVAWGDVNGDGDLDLAVGNGDYPQGQPNHLYENVNGVLTTTPSWTSTTEYSSVSLAWGDVNNDGYLDLAVGNYYDAPTELFLNQEGTLSNTSTLVESPHNTSSIAWGDYDGDGDPDLALGDASGENVLYRNGGGTLTSSTAWPALADLTASLAWGDVDNDGDLDLATSNFTNQPVRLYRNERASLLVTNPTATTEITSTSAVAWGDADRDGDLDLAVASGEQQIGLFENEAGALTVSPVWSTTVISGSSSLAWGDVNGDGDLDLAVGGFPHTYVYSNQNGIFNIVWTSVETEATAALAWGDVDGDGDLDLAVGNAGGSGNQDRLYLNENGILTASAVWSTPPNESDITKDIAWGDVDGDGDLDLVMGSDGHIRLYQNEAGQLTTNSVWSPHENDINTSVAWGDYDSDGDLDLATGNYFGPNRLYRNDGGQLTTNAVWASAESDATLTVVWGDYDGDGDLDLFSGNYLVQPDRLYRNDEGQLTASAAWSTPEVNFTTSAAWGDYDSDGDLDLFSGNYLVQPYRLYQNNRDNLLSLAPTPLIHLTYPQPAAEANFYASAAIQTDSTLILTYTLSHPRSQPVQQIIGQYSLSGGGQWLPAVATSSTITTNLTTSPSGTTHLYNWDIPGSGVLGQSDNVVFRLVAIPAITNTPNQIPGPYLYGSFGTHTFPFRVRGTQVQVISGTQGISNAMVYRLKAGQPYGGQAFANGAGQPFHTNSQGYLQGRGEIKLGDRLLALAPVPLPPIDTKRYSNTLRLYYTNGLPTETGLEAFTVNQTGVQTVTVSAANPLLIFDLDVSLEWDASNDPIYLQQLEFDLSKTSEFLYDFTNGQMALGKVTVHQNKEAWDTAHIIVQATNRLRPFAVQGGIVITDTPDLEHTGEITYSIGQVTMGATWNRYGNAGQNLGQDWPLTLAHELSHYLLFVDDTYLGVDENGLLIPVPLDPLLEPGCTGSAMGDTYVPDNTEFVPDGQWLPKCKDTLTHKTLGRSEWATIKLWYPWLNAPVATNSGPSLMPFDFTTITTLPPPTSTATLEDPTFYLDYAGGAVSSSEGQGVLFRSTDGNPADYETVIDLGSPLGGQNRLLARGAQLVDRLCAFDPVRKQYGCEVIEVGDERLKLESNATWTPLIRLSPVNSKTFGLTVEAIPGGLNLKAKLYPDDGPASGVIPLVQTGGVYQGQFNLAEPALAGQVQMWVDETATENNPRREAVVAYSIGGNPGRRRAGNAPLVSPDGQFIFFTKAPLILAEGEFYAIQNLASLPPLPPGKKTLGPSYNLVATPGAPPLVGSVSFQYLGLDALVEGLNENNLTIHFWNGSRWQALPTVRSSYYNLASASSQGPGIYTLLGGVTVPNIVSVTPPTATNDLTKTLVISGSNFLPPVEVALLGPTATYTLPVTSVTSISLTAVVSRGLPANEYQVRVINGDGGLSPTPGIFALYEPDSACFYDFFESGAGKWQLSGDWAIVRLPDGQQVMTDSPAGPYKNAGDYALGALKHITTITSDSFNLARCPQPVLTFSHAYVLAKVGDSQDTGRVEIFTDNGTHWTELTYYRGGGVYGPRAQAVNSLEWANTVWQEVVLDLKPYTGTIRLRFSLEVDQTASDKGWALDNVMVKQKTISRFFLPFIIKKP